MATILLVDDDRLIQEKVGDVLKAEGYTLVTRSSGAEIFDVLQSQELDLVLLDLILPDGSGVDFLSFIAQKDPDLPVIIVTGYASLTTAMEAIKKGAYDYLQKPVIPEILLAAVRRAVEKRTTNKQAAALMVDLSQKIHEVLIRDQIGEIIASRLDSPYVLRSLADATRSALMCEGCCLFLLEEATGNLRVEVTVGEKTSALTSLVLRPSQGIVGWVMEAGEPAVVNDVAVDPRFFPGIDQVTGFTTRSLLAAPLTVKGRRIGVIEAVNSRRAEGFTPNDLRLLTSLGRKAAIAIENARLYHQVQQQLQDLVKLQETKENLTQLIVHDLKSPLTSVTLFLETLHSKPEIVQEGFVASYLQEAERSCSLMTNLITDLLDIGKMEEGKLPLRREVCDVPELVKECVEGLRLWAETKNIILTAEKVSESLPVSLDRRLTARVITNLLTNALDHTPEKGRVSTRVSREGAGVRLEVSDTGEGIPAEFQEKIFEKFGQVELRMHGIRGRSGLGLTFCKMAVEAHGGHIGLTSTPGSGSTFFVVLPALLEGRGSDPPH